MTLIASRLNVRTGQRERRVVVVVTRVPVRSSMTGLALS